MKCFFDTRGKNEFSPAEQSFTEEQFFEQFAALEEGLAALQTHLRSMSENVKRFGSITGHIRRSVCPTVRLPEKRV